MHILVLNGSPKGEYSITLQTVLYLQKKFPEQSFEILHVGKRINALEKDFSPAVDAINGADVLLFSYPVYTFIAPYQLHRFIELMKLHKVNVSGKIATQITTSKHFYDITAHRYIQDNAQDMGMSFISGLSADMEDLTTPQGQQEAISFFRYFLWRVEQKFFGSVPTAVPVTAPIAPTPVAKGPTPEKGDVVIVADLQLEDTQLQAMIDRFRNTLPYATRLVNIREYPLRGGCLGCFRCASDGKCVYTDGFHDFLRNQIQTADAIVYAFKIQDHAMGTRFKMYDDRQFCNGHRTVTIGMPVGYLISGNYSKEQNLQTILEARAQVGGNILAGMATDEFDTDKAIDRLSASLYYAMENHNTQPRNFYGIGGMKIFRDLIYQMRGMMKADHRFFKSHGQYDFPQKKWPQSMMMYLVGAMNSNPKLRNKIGNKMNEGMIAPYKKVLDKCDL